MVKINLKNPAELNALLSAADTKSLSRRGRTLKDIEEVNGQMQR